MLLSLVLVPRKTWSCYEVDDATGRSETPSEILNVPSSSGTHTFAANITDLQTRIQELETKLDASSKSKKKYRAKAKELKQKVEDLEEKLKHPVSKAKVELVAGSGVFLSKSKIAAAKLGSRSPTILARNLFRYLFSPEELAGHSLMGRSCNANKYCSVLPSISAVKRDALVEFALEAYNINPSITGRGVSEEYKHQKSRILASLTKLLREESKKADFIQCD
ncbi:unnamed protein product [Allacma fusca]|uniref:BEN domain-containing protein n=1 Tax=Allacma fusca TaxID=39272 RepID=A0A8J2JCL1_9HEXA|nr:unnamed protein product [Allacma fusca]